MVVNNGKSKDGILVSYRYAARYTPLGPQSMKGNQVEIAAIDVGVNLCRYICQDVRVGRNVCSTSPVYAALKYYWYTDRYTMSFL